MMNDKSLDIEMVERTLQPENQSFEPTSVETGSPVSEQTQPPKESIVKLLYYPYRIRKKIEIIHRLICISFIVI